MPINVTTTAPASPDPDDRKQRKTASSFKAGTPRTGSNDAAYIPYAKGRLEKLPLVRTAQFQGAGWNAIYSPPQMFNPIQTPQQWQIASKRREIYQWARHWYDNEPKVAAGIDFYAQFPMCGFKLECKKSHIKRYYDKLCEDLKLNYWLKYISHEYFLLGDVFPFLEIQCPQCNGKGTDEDGQPCKHVDGKFKRIECLNPDFIEVQRNHIDDRPDIFMIPDEQLKMVVMKRIEPIYSRLDPYVRECVAGNRPIKLSSRSCSHIRHNAAPYQIYGTSLLRRMFTTLAYKTKLMTANWIVAERLVLPVRICKVGDKDRPATAEDIQDMQQNLSAIAMDPNMTIVTHHAVDLDYVGATGKIHQISQEMELIGKEILDGFMLNQALLNGEMGHYSSAQVGVEAILHRLESWRNTLSDWVYEHLFKPTAMMQGFVDEEATAELQQATKDENDIVYLYPKIKWNDMQLRDNSQQMQIFIQLNQEGKLSNDTLLKKLDLSWDEEVEKMRAEQADVGPNGQMPGGQQGGGGGGGMGGDMGGGGGGGGMPGDPTGGGGMDPTGGGGMAPGAGMAPGGGMGGGPMGATASAPMGMDAGMGAPGAGQSSQMRINKKGNGPKPGENDMPPQPTRIKLTKLERMVWKAIEQLDIPFTLFGQFKIAAPGEPQPYQMDWAFPAVKVDIEADGPFHETEKAKTNNTKRDQKLAAMGWRILRFKEDAINDHLEEVKNIIYANVYDAAQALKKGQSKKASIVQEGDVRLECSEIFDEESGFQLGTVIAKA